MSDRNPAPTDGGTSADPEAAATVLQPHEVFERVGGLPTFERLVDAFYRRVEQDELLRPMYPDDLEPGKRRLALFFAQYWGGGDLYSRERGHPRLRMRHAPFPVSSDAALRWAEHMAASIRELRVPADAEALLLTYVARATPTLINQAPERTGTLPQHGNSGRPD